MCFLICSIGIVVVVIVVIILIILVLMYARNPACPRCGSSALLREFVLPLQIVRR
jgi:hypothetical protein